MASVRLTDAFVDDFRRLSTIDGGELEFKQIKSSVFAGLALYLPQAIGIFVLSAYFTGLFAKAGEEHYGHLKDAIKWTWRKANQIEVTAIGSPSDKITDFDEFQMAFSISGSTPDKRYFKLVLRKRLSDEMAEAGIDKFLDLIRDINLGRLSDHQMAVLATYKAIGGTVIVTIDAVTGEILPAE